MTVVLIEPTGGAVELDEILHFVCPGCYPPPATEGVAVCGVDAEAVSAPDVDNPPPEKRCVVCSELIESPCLKCGCLL